MLPGPLEACSADSSTLHPRRLSFSHVAPVVLRRDVEKVEDVAKARGISMAELRELNPNLRGTKVLLLPADRYTVREQEMMTGVLGMPQNFFKQGGVANMLLFSAAGFTAFLLALALRAAERRD